MTKKIVKEKVEGSKVKKLTPTEQRALDLYEVDMFIDILKLIRKNIEKGIGILDEYELPTRVMTHNTALKEMKKKKKKGIRRVGYVFYFPEEKPKRVELVIKDKKTHKTLAEKRIPFPKVNIPFVPPKGAWAWFEKNGGIDVLHFQ